MEDVENRVKGRKGKVAERKGGAMAIREGVCPLAKDGRENREPGKKGVVGRSEIGVEVVDNIMVLIARAGHAHSIGTEDSSATAMGDHVHMAGLGLLIPVPRGDKGGGEFGGR